MEPVEIVGHRVTLWGRQDTWIPAAQADRFAAAIPGSRVVLFDRCRHMPQEEQAKETADLIEGFLAQ